jgi:hypothetical protein
MIEMMMMMMMMMLMMMMMMMRMMMRNARKTRVRVTRQWRAAGQSAVHSRRRRRHSESRCWTKRWWSDGEQ